MIFGNVVMHNVTLMKNGQVQPVAMKCPKIMIENVQFEQKDGVYD